MMRKEIMLISLFLLSSALSAQIVVQPSKLEVTVNKTTNLVFPAAISSVDRGSERIIVQKFTGNVLRVKADTSFSDTTNLTVITSDGKLYSFLVSYAASPVVLNIDLGAAKDINLDTAILGFATTTLSMINWLHGVRYGSGKVRLQLMGIYTNGNLIACKLRIENNSPLSFEIGRIAAQLGSSQTVKRRASQELTVPILLVRVEATLIREHQSVVLVLVLPKTGLAPGKKLQVQMQEKGGDRFLSLSISNRYILNAYLIP